MSDAVWTRTEIEGMWFVDARPVDKQPMGLPWYNLMTVYYFRRTPMCDVKGRKKAAGSLSKQMSTGQRWEGGKQSAIIYSWLFTRDRVIQAEGLITWPDLRSTVTDHCQSRLLPRSTLNCPLNNIKTVIRSQVRNPSGFLINITILNWYLTSCHYRIIANNEVEVTIFIHSF